MLTTTRREFLRRAAVLAVASREGDDANAKKPGQPTSRGTYRHIGTYTIPQTDLVVSRIGYGCADFVGQSGEPLDVGKLNKVENLVHTACEQGITLFDLADTYGLGRSEEAIGALLKRSPSLRSDLVLQTKSGMDFKTAHGLVPRMQFDCSYRHLIESVDGSLRRLATDYLDILLLHWPDALVEPEEVAKAFDKLKHSGKVRYFGVSNHLPGQIEMLKRFVPQPLVVNQVRIGLALAARIVEDYANTTLLNTERNGADHWPGMVTGTLAYCRVHNIQIQAYSPLRGDLLKPRPDSDLELKNLSDTLINVARRNNIAPSAMALAWLMRHPARIIPIIGTENPEHIVENCASDRVIVSRDDWYELFRAALAVV